MLTGGEFGGEEVYSIDDEEAISFMFPMCQTRLIFEELGQLLRLLQYVKMARGF